MSYYKYNTTPAGTKAVRVNIFNAKRCFMSKIFNTKRQADNYVNKLGYLEITKEQLDQMDCESILHEMAN